MTSHVEALEEHWSKALDDGCPHCGPVGFTGCDHIEGYHYALSDLREAIDADRRDGGLSPEEVPGLRMEAERAMEEADSLRFELSGARSTAKGDNEYLLGRAKKAEQALEALMWERNTWARQMADLRDERDAALAQAETIRTNALGTENQMIADLTNLKSRILDLADLYDEAGRTRTPRPTWAELAQEIRRTARGSDFGVENHE